MSQKPCLFCLEPISDASNEATLECCNASACKKCLKEFVQRKKSEGHLTDIICPNENCQRKASAATLEMLCDTTPSTIPVLNSCPFCWTEAPDTDILKRVTTCESCHMKWCKLCHKGDHKGSCIPRVEVWFRPKC